MASTALARRTGHKYRHRGELYSYRLWLARRDSTTLAFSSVAMRLGLVLAGPVRSCVGAAGRFAAVCCVRGGGCSEG